MMTIREVIQMAMIDYNKCSFMCHNVEELGIYDEDITKTLDFIKSQLRGFPTLTNFLSDTVPEYEQLCYNALDGYEDDEPHAYRVKWWNEVIQLPEAQV